MSKLKNADVNGLTGQKCLLKYISLRNYEVDVESLENLNIFQMELSSFGLKQHLLGAGKFLKPACLL